MRLTEAQADALVGKSPGRKPKRKSAKSEAAELFAFHCRAYRMPEFVREHRFAQELEREWRFDFAWLGCKVAVEVEGLIVRRVFLDGSAKPTFIVQGRHATIDGIREDMEKYNSAALLGWTVLRYEQSTIKSGAAIAMTLRVLTARNAITTPKG